MTRVVQVHHDRLWGIRIEGITPDLQSGQTGALPVFSTMNCEICNQDFESVNRFCSQKCRNTYISRNTAEKRNESNKKVAAEKREKRNLERIAIEAARDASACENSTNLSLAWLSGKTRFW